MLAQMTKSDNMSNTLKLRQAGTVGRFGVEVALRH